MPSRTVRSLLLPSLAALSLALAACTSTTQRCDGGICSISLSGEGASVTVGGDGGSTLELVSIDGQTARFKVDETEGNLTKDVPVGFGDNATITLKAIDGDQVEVTVDTTTAPEDAAIGN